VELFELVGREHLKAYEVKMPQLKSYDCLLNVENISEAMGEENEQTESAVG
jgi:hypothetical protein